VVRLKPVVAVAAKAVLVVLAETVDLAVKVDKVELTYTDRGDILKLKLIR
tara:strand:+ start:36 stop:185 length:150 start_codon:yes stop_codon:yes gene_type:complete